MFRKIISLLQQARENFGKSNSKIAWNKTWIVEADLILDRINSLDDDNIKNIKSTYRDNND